MHGEAKRNLEFIGGERDRQLQQLWAETKIGDILPWEDVEREAERLLESTRANARNSENSGVSQEQDDDRTVDRDETDPYNEVIFYNEAWPACLSRGLVELASAGGPRAWLPLVQARAQTCARGGGGGAHKRTAEVGGSRRADQIRLAWARQVGGQRGKQAGAAQIGGGMLAGGSCNYKLKWYIYITSSTRRRLVDIFIVSLN